jgi:hypothetical protein
MRICIDQQSFQIVPGGLEGLPGWKKMGGYAVRG